MGRYQMLLEQMAQGLNVSYSIPSHRKQNFWNWPVFVAEFLNSLRKRSMRQFNHYGSCL